MTKRLRVLVSPQGVGDLEDCKWCRFGRRGNRLLPGGSLNYAAAVHCDLHWGWADGDVENPKRLQVCIDSAVDE